MNAINPIVLPGKSFDLNTFTFNGHTLRTVTFNGILRFPCVDVAHLLGLNPDSFTSNMRRITNQGQLLCVTRAEAKVTPQLEGVLFPSFGGRINLMDEPALYLAILRAQRSNPAAKDFQDWVTQEVIPRIRGDGAYIMGEEKIATGEVKLEDFYESMAEAIRGKVADPGEWV
ncbi:BRO-N domain-containing protein [Rhodobacter maris]|uniref:Prophage antirepressor-like protein n=1 Tax=Rhodobacter maris TaxID=446682 RepID=A0A285RZX3_9RHOB|nr:BRO family protein [Rhodobacter maris]SOC00140.1 prophage antirepressor-like protein [Rhodobacter maris]